MATVKNCPVRVIFLVYLSLQGNHSTRINQEGENFEEKVDDFVNALLSCRQLVSLNLAVVEGNRTLLTKGYGVADIDRGASVSRDSLYGIASLSKAFAATLLGKVLEENGSYSWDARVVSILGDDFYFFDDVLTEEATLRDLLAHQTGLSGYNMVRLQHGMDRKTLAQKIRFLRRTAKFRDSHAYSNLMYGVISYVTEVLGGDSWETLMRRHLFEPLGMAATTFTHEVDRATATSRMAVPYLYNHDGAWRPVSFDLHRYWGIIGGAGSIVTNAVDMTKWLKFQLSLGRNEQGEEVVLSKIVSATHERVKVIPHGRDDELYRRPNAPRSYIFDEYALGWRRGYYRGWPVIVHTGTSFGYGALLTIVPDADISIYTSLSGPDSGYRARRALHLYILDLLTGSEPFLNTSSACTFPDIKPKRKLPPAQDVVVYNASIKSTAYEGQYGHFAYGNISVKVSDVSGRLQLIYGPLGIWDLYTAEREHAFSGHGVHHVWPIFLSNVTFGGFNPATGFMEELSIAFERTDPPLFIRGLRMSDAPGRKPTCGDVTSHAHSGTYAHIHLLFFLSLICFINLYDGLVFAN